MWGIVIYIFIYFKIFIVVGPTSFNQNFGCKSPTSLGSEKGGHLLSYINLLTYESHIDCKLKGEVPIFLYKPFPSSLLYTLKY